MKAECRTPSRAWLYWTERALLCVGAATAAWCAAVWLEARYTQSRPVGDLVITQAWSRATPGGAKIGGGYLTIQNKGSAADRLIGGSADVADKVQVHEMATSRGVMTMRPLDKGLSIEPGKTVKLAPGGYHLMLRDLKSPLKQGDQVPVTLEFEKAGKVKLTFDVQDVAAQGPGGAGNTAGPKDIKKMPDHSGMKM